MSTNNNIKPISLKNVKINDSFWSKYEELVHSSIIPYQYNALSDNVEGAVPSYAIANFKIAAKMQKGEFGGMVFQDSDLAKWIEALAYMLQTNPDDKWEAIGDEVIAAIENAQQEDGYLNTYFILKEPDKKWTNLHECHELYCAGHMMEAAVAYYNATGKRKLLDVMCKVADHIDSIIGPEEGKIKGYPGHQEIELALVKLYETTKNEKYLTLAKYFIDERGKKPYFFDLEWEKREGEEHFGEMRSFGNKYNQSHLPVREQKTAEGHSVRAVYMYSGMADLARETNDKGLYEACKSLWDNIVSKRMYITGSIGSERHGEAFTLDYDLPNDTVYGETCAAIGLIFFAHRMLQIEAKGNYADIMEKVLYNGAISGMSLDGKSFFYVNPLEVWPEACEKNHTRDHVKVERQKWFGCACCPPNLSRLLASLGEYIYGTNDDTIFTHLYVGSKAETKIKGTKIELTQKTNYPWCGDIEIDIKTECQDEFTIALRIPEWCDDYEIQVNGENIAPEKMIDGYAYIKRTWDNADTIKLKMDMQVKRIVSNPKVRENIGKVALQRGPIVYCLEEADNGTNLHQIMLPKDSELSVEFDNDLLGGINIIKANAIRITDDEWEDTLYKSNTQIKTSPCKVKFIPYYSWANRGAGELVTWIREK